MKKEKLIFIAIVSTILIVGIFLFWFFVRDQRKDNIPPEKEVQQEVSKEIPEEFPEDFPLLPDLEVDASWKKVEDGNLGLSISFKTKSEVNEVVDFFQIELTKKGWDYETVGVDEKGATMSFENKKWRGFLGMVREGQETVVSIALGKK